MMVDSAKHLIVDCGTGEATEKPFTKAEAAERNQRVNQRAADEAAATAVRERAQALRLKPNRTHEENIELTNHLADLLGIPPVDE